MNGCSRGVWGCSSRLKHSRLFLLFAVTPRHCKFCNLQTLKVKAPGYGLINGVHCMHCCPVPAPLLLIAATIHRAVMHVSIALQRNSNKPQGLCLQVTGGKSLAAFQQLCHRIKHQQLHSHCKQRADATGHGGAGGVKFFAEHTMLCSTNISHRLSNAPAMP